jgi:mono/diheme cytochrome c family protein
VKILLKILKYVVLILPLLILIYIGLIALEIIDRSKSQPLELISDMNHNAKIKPQSYSRFFEDSTIQRAEINNTYPVKTEKYTIDQLDFLFADSILTNPIAMNETNTKIGKYLYQTYCFYCHGHTGKADGPIITDVQLDDDEEGFPAPSDLTSQRTKKLSDARIYHILSAGQNLMFPYNDRLNPEKRWTLVNYIRKLQKDDEEVNK